MERGKSFQHRVHRGHRERRVGLSRLPSLPSPSARPFQVLLIAIPFLLVAGVLFSADCIAQENPAFKIDENITRFAYSGSGRIAYATRHVFSVKKIQLQRDDVWIAEADGKKRRILLGEKFVRGTGPFSYTVRGMRWSPDGSKLAIELGTSEMINEDGDTREGVMTLLLDDVGREITMPGGDSVIPGAMNAAWLTDEVSVAYLSERPQENAKAPAAAAGQVSSNRAPSDPDRQSWRRRGLDRQTAHGRPERDPR